MKRVITANTIKQAAAAGKKQLYAPLKETIITPEARTVASQLGVELLEFSLATPQGKPIDENLVRQVMEQVMKNLPPSKQNYQKIKSVVIEVLTAYLKKNS
ncbi:MAG: hypothetical protein J7L94_14670 [Caldisericaceae bacterium]|nr:hypothetical protein [Caldisericaceae bacterium]